jgi:hypothetical protein
VFFGRWPLRGTAWGQDQGTGVITTEDEYFWAAGVMMVVRASENGWERYG